MAARGAIDLSFRADLSNLTKQLAKMPETTEKEAKAMVKALEKQFKSAEKAAERAAKSAGNAWQKSGKRVRGAAADTKRVSEEMDQLSHRAGDADSALKGVGGALGLVSPEAEAVFQTVGELGGGLEGMIRTLKAGVGPLGLVAAAVAAGAFAWKHYSEELEEAEQKTKDMADAALEMSNAVSAMKASLEMRELEALVRLGQEDVEVLKRAKVERAVASEMSETRKLLVEREAAAVQALTKAQIAHSEAQERNNFWGLSTLKIDREHGAEIKRKQSLVDASRKALKNLNAEQEFQVQLTLEGMEADEKNRKAKTRSTSAVKKTKDAIEELIQSTERLIPDDRSKVEILADQMATLQAESAKTAEAANRLAPSIASIQGAIDKIKADEFTAELQEIQEEEDKWIQKTKAAGQAFADSGKSIQDGEALLVSLRDASNQSAEAMAELAPVIAAVEKRINDINVEQAKAKLAEVANQIQSIGGPWMSALQNIGQLNLNQAMKDGKKALEVFDKRAEGLNEQLEDINQQISQTTNEATKKQLEAEKALIEGRLAANEEARKEEEEIQNQAVAKAFGLQQQLQIAQITMNTATAIMQAWAQLGPLGASFATAGITALGATQAALVAQQEPPTLHMGGMIRPDEQMVKARIGEGVLTAQGVNAIGGEAGLNAANSGGNMPTRIVVQQVYKHKVLDTVLSDSIARGGPIGSAINKRTPRGRRNPHKRAS